MTVGNTRGQSTKEFELSGEIGLHSSNHTKIGLTVTDDSIYILYHALGVKLLVSD